MVKKIIIYSFLYLITFFIVLSVFIIQPSNRSTYNFLQIIILMFISLLIVKYVKTIILILIAPWNTVVKTLREKHFSSVGYHPLVSVVIPAYNEEVGILATVKTVLQSYYKNLELIVVNDGSTDNSHNIMLDFIQDRLVKGEKDNLKYFYKQNEGKGEALNYGIKRSRGDIIITIDADCVVAPETISNFVKPFADPGISAVVGNVKIGNTNTVITTVQYLEFLNSFYAKNAESVLGTIYIIGGAAASFRRSVFDKIGSYSNVNITEDIEISVRIRKAGLRVVYADDAIVYTEGANDVRGLAKQRLRWKIGWFQTLYLHKDLVFSKDKQHNKILSWIMIPLVYFSNIQLVFEPWFIIFLYIYSFLMHNFSPFITWIGVEAVMITMVALIDRQHQKLSIFILAPITWLLFYLSTYIEYQSLLFTIWNTIKKKEVKWQKWQRRGCGIETSSSDL